MNMIESPTFGVGDFDLRRSQSMPHPAAFRSEQSWRNCYFHDGTGKIHQQTLDVGQQSYASRVSTWTATRRATSNLPSRRHTRNSTSSWVRKSMPVRRKRKQRREVRFLPDQIQFFIQSRTLFVQVFGFDFGTGTVAVRRSPAGNHALLISRSRERSFPHRDRSVST